MAPIRVVQSASIVPTSRSSTTASARLREEIMELVKYCRAISPTSPNVSKLVSAQGSHIRFCRCVMHVTSNFLCVCRSENEPAKFACSNSECGSPQTGCINVYGDLNECCSTSTVCEDSEKDKLATCWNSGVEYREGEKFIPQATPCYECICHQDFSNVTSIADNPHCHKLNCEIELRYKSFIQRGCLPVFHHEKCCPVDWECRESIAFASSVLFLFSFHAF